MRSIWKGALAFGLVNIPVKLYSATESSTPGFDMLDKKNHARIRYKRVNEETGREVEWENIVKGYLYKDEYVIMDDQDFADAAPEKSKLIEIKEFVDIEEITPLYFETPYYIEPEKSGFKAYGLLREALIKSGKAGVATFVLRNAEILAVISPNEKMIVLYRIRFPQEIRETKDFVLPSASEVKAQELKIALALIKQFSAKFKPEKYKDTYSNELMKIIKLKASGKRPKVRKLTVVKTKNADLMAQLKASLGNTKKRAS